MYVRFPCLVNSLNGVINICLNEHTPYIQFKKAGATYKTVLAGVKEKERCLKLVRALIEHPVIPFVNCINLQRELPIERRISGKNRGRQLKMLRSRLSDGV